VTIDPKDARDFDDAFCLEPRAAGGSTLWIHIADVSHYVREGSLLDREARARGNSTYLVDRVIPMLPESLSNGLCSLLPNVDRLTVCVEFALSDDGIVEGAKFYPAVIRSQRRFTYEEVSAILAKKPANAIERMLVAADRIASRMRRRRFSSGAFDLEMPETKIHLDAAGRVSRVSPASHDSAHRLIEEFMLLANEAVAAHLARQKKPMLHRIHEEPEPDRIASFRATVQKSRVRCGDLRQRAEVQDLLARLRESQDGALLRVGFLKAMSRARYATQPLGHYGLAKEHYTHFTSPIRRYADLVVHRLLRRVGASSPSKSSEAELSEIANHVSATERNSAAAERVSKVVKLLAHFADQLRTGKHDRYTATIVAVREFGFFVDLEGLGIGGLVRESRSRREVGDRLEVEVEGIDPGRREARFKVVRSDDSRTLEQPAARVNRPARLGTLRE
jgi:ribonuclease R